MMLTKSAPSRGQSGLSRHTLLLRPLPNPQLLSLVGTLTLAALPASQSRKLRCALSWAEGASADVGRRLEPIIILMCADVVIYLNLNSRSASAPCQTERLDHTLGPMRDRVRSHAWPNPAIAITRADVMALLNLAIALATYNMVMVLQSCPSSSRMGSSPGHLIHLPTLDDETSELGHMKEDSANEIDE